VVMVLVILVVLIAAAAAVIIIVVIVTQRAAGTPTGASSVSRLIATTSLHPTQLMVTQQKPGSVVRLSSLQPGSLQLLYDLQYFTYCCAPINFAKFCFAPWPNG